MTYMALSTTDATSKSVAAIGQKTVNLRRSIAPQVAKIVQNNLVKRRS